MALLCGEMFITGKCRPLSTSLWGRIASPVAWSGAWGLSHVVSPLHRPTCLVSPAVSHIEAAASRPSRHCPACTGFLEPLCVRCRLLLVHFLFSLLPGSFLLSCGLSLCSRPRAAGPPRGFSFCVMSTKPSQFSSVAQSCLTLCNPMDCSNAILPVHHQLPETAQSHVH